jgi:hypothetical protein
LKIQTKIYIILFLSILCNLTFAQQTYKITEGELQFVSFKKGIIIKKADGFYRLEPIENSEEKFQHTKLELSELEKLKNYKTTVFKDDIIKTFDLNSLKNKKFTYTNEDKEEDYGFLFNELLFASFRKNEENKLPKFDDLSPFIFIQINGLKFIYIFENGVYIIPTKTELKVLVTNNYSDETIFSVEKHITTADEISLCSDKISSNQEDYYNLLIKKEKYQLINKLEKVVISKKYDSIFFKKVIIGQKKKGFDLYNYQYKKLNQKPVKAFHIYLNKIQFLQNNKCITTDYNGIETDPLRFGFFETPYMPDGTKLFILNITKDKNDFILDINKGRGGRSEKVLKLINTENIENFYFPNNKSDDYWGDLYSYESCSIYYQMKDKSYGFGSLNEFIKSENDNRSIELNDFKNLQEVKVCNFQTSRDNGKFFKLKKNNLYLYYPLQKQFRYKILNNFQGYFARFELPNGQKGWLSLDGKEYLDE